MGKIIITRADEVEKTLQEKTVAAVLSIEHPGAVPGGKGAAPRLADVTQDILCFWDAEQVVQNGPDRPQVERGVQFILEHLEKGDVLVHCHAGKSRSVAIAIGALAVRHPEKEETEIIDMILAIRPIAAPNIIIIEMVDDIAGRNGRLRKAIEDHPVLTAQRTQAEKNRQAVLAKNPDQARQLFPEKFPKP